MGSAMRAGERVWKRTPRRFPGPMLWVAVVLLAAAAVSSCSRSEDALAGTVLTSSDPAPPFELQDQFGRSVSLADHRDNVVVLTFLYTYCPDICPIVASHLRETYQALGEDVDRVEFVAISVDPARDTVERALEYSEQWEMADRWSFLVGSEDQLAPVWKAYFIDPAPDPAESEEEGGEDHQRDDGGGSVDALREALFTISHSAPVYLIDRDGLLRVLFTPPLDPDVIVHDVRLLLD